MARWKLTEKHYLYTEPPTEWEQVEIDLTTGEQVRRRFTVPKFIDPDDPKFKNGEGIVVVCQGEKGNPKDIIFLGLPTASMLPIDEEATAISESMVKGEHPIESLDDVVTESPSVLKTMQAQINALMMANDELMRRIASNESASAEDAKADIAAIAAQQPKVAKDRRV